MSAKTCPQCGREYAETEKFCTEDGATLRGGASADGLVNSVVADRYHVTKKLGEGGMGQVYLAEHVRMKRKCALKVMHPAMGQDPDAVQRFSREAANAAQIIHPNVAAVFDFGETPDRLIYLAMEYVEGDSLSALVEQNGALPARRAAAIAAQAADGLAAAHELGIVHRDLKPDNIMIARARDGSDLVKVVDFGIAKAMGGGGEGQKVTRTGFVIGTPEYMSPEQLVGDPVDGRSDIYSLALVAFNMFTGTLPFPSRTSQEAMIARLTQQPKTLAEMRGDVPWPPRLQAVMDKALARDPHERYTNAKEFGRELADSMRHMPNLTVEQLGTQMQAAVSAAKLAGPSGVRATPTMAMAPHAGAFSATAVGAPLAPAPHTPGAARVATAPLASPADGRGNKAKLAVGAGVGLVAIAGAIYALGGRNGDLPAADTGAAVPTVASAAASTPAEGGAPDAPSTPAGTPTPGQSATTSATTSAATSAAPTDAPPVASVPVERGTPPRPAPTRQPVTPPRGASTPATTPQPQAPVQTAPAVTMPAPQPVVPTPRETMPARPAAPTFDAAAATSEVRQAIQSFVAAFETRRIENVRRWYPGMSPSEIRDWDALLTEKQVSDLKSTLQGGIGEPDFDPPNAATVNFTMKFEYRAGGQRQTPPPQRYTAKLRRDGNAWRIQDLQAQ